MKMRSFALLIAALGCISEGCLNAQPVVFDFDSGAPPLSTGQILPLQQTAGGVTALFSSASAGNFSVQTASSTGWKLSRFSGNFLSPDGLSSYQMDIQFSRPLSAISLNFATADFQQVEVPTTLQLTAFLDSAANPPVGSSTAHGTYAGDTMPMGTLSFDSGGRPFNLVKISFPPQPRGAPNFLVDNVAVTMVAPPALRSVSAASYMPGQPLAPGSMATALGSNLAPAVATAGDPPFPVSLGGAEIVVQDSAGQRRSAALMFVAPGSITYLIPDNVALGPATVSVMNGGAQVASGAVTIAAVAPGLFSANGNGQGVAAGWAVKTWLDGNQTAQALSQCGPDPGSCVAAPLDLGGASGMELVLLGTGIRGRSALSAVVVTLGGTSGEVLYAGADESLPGIDRVNVRVPLGLAGQGEVPVLATVDGKPANLVIAGFQ